MRSSPRVSLPSSERGHPGRIPFTFAPAGEPTVARMTPTIGRMIQSLDTIDSTQTALGALARQGAPEGAVVTARHQTAGRGRRGHGWWDATGESLLLSILLRPPVALEAAPSLSLMAGLAVTDALRGRTGVRAELGWPNDVLVRGRKIAGILPEAVAGEGGTISHVILGIGVNVSQAAFPPDLADLATSLRLVTGWSLDPAELLGPVLTAMDRRYHEWLRGGFGAMRGEWRERSIIIGQSVRSADGRAGVAVDVAEDGALLVDAGTGKLVRVVSAAAIERGEVERDAARP